VIPGILGSRLVDDETEKLVWGRFERVGFVRRRPDGVSAIALPMREGVPLRQLRDSIRSDGTLAYLEIDVAGVPFEIQAYDDILTSLGVGGYRDPQHPNMQEVDYGDKHFTCFQFDYDWRRDVSENAVRLHEFIERQRQSIRQEYQRRYGIVDANLKFDIVAHSMGGLVARYYLRYGPRPLPDDGSLPPLDWAGAQNVARVVLVGTPNAGSTLAMRDLIDGHQLAPLLPEYPAAVLGTMPATYQLLPRSRHRALVDAADGQRKIDLYDPVLWRDMKWGLASPEQEHVLRELLPDVTERDVRLRIALDHQRKCLLRARQLHQALDIPTQPPPGVTLHLFAGDSIETPSVLAVDLETGEIDTVKNAAGDDTTTRASAVMDERSGGSRAARLVSPIHWTSTMFLHASHRGLTSDPIFTDNVLALLLESPQPPTIPTTAQPPLRTIRGRSFMPPDSLGNIH
jgi:pimeloyl-ACP methyl ester carboxylesterase